MVTANCATRGVRRSYKFCHGRRRVLPGPAFNRESMTMMKMGAAFAIVLVLSCVSGAVVPDSQLLSDQAVVQRSELSSQAAYLLPARDVAERACKVTCNGVEVASTLDSETEPKSCVGTLKVFCKGNTTTGLGVAGSKCEGKSTLVKGLAVCEGALQNFVKKGFTAPDGKFIKSTRAFGCLGTSIGLSINGSRNNSDTTGFGLEEKSDAVLAEDVPAVDAVLADGTRSLEGRCDGLSVRFQAAKVVGDCGKHSKSRDQHADKHAQADQPQPLDPSIVGSQSEEVLVGLPGARRSLAGHHDKHDKKHADKAKHHHGDDDDDKISNDHKDKHQPKHGDKHGHSKQCQMTFDDAESKVQRIMQKSGVEWLPRELPSGSGLVEGPQGPDCKITCNGRPTWFGAFFPCFGELKVDCEGGSRALPRHIAGSDLDSTSGAGNGFEFHGACKGYWSGALFKTCSGFSTAHIEVENKDVWDFCSGKKAVRMGGAPGKGFFSSSACRGKDLLVVEKEDK